VSDNGGVADGDHVSFVEGSRLWDAHGQEWTTKHSTWVDADRAGAFARRDGIAGFLDGPGRPVRWATADQTRQWWRQAQRHFEVPGKSLAPSDEDGRTWTAHIWRRGTDRLIVFEAHC
jgi:hypothetical protein